MTLTAAGLIWNKVPDPWEEFVDEAMEVVAKYGISRPQIEQDMIHLKPMMDDPKTNREALKSVFIQGLEEVFKNGL